MVDLRTAALGLGAFLAFRTFFGGNSSGGGKSGKGGKGGGVTNFVTYRVDPSEPFGPRWKTQRPPGLPLDAREASAEGEGERWVRQIADQQGLGPAFTGAILSLAHNESGGTFIIGLPANNFDTRPSSERPRVERGSRYDQYPRDTGGDGIQDVITAWGLFQFNKGAWQRLSGRSLRTRSCGTHVSSSRQNASAHRTLPPLALSACIIPVLLTGSATRTSGRARATGSAHGEKPTLPTEPPASRSNSPFTVSNEPTL